jgi:hypothetical protein
MAMALLTSEEIPKDSEYTYNQKIPKDKGGLNKVTQYHFLCWQFVLFIYFILFIYLGDSFDTVIEMVKKLTIFTGTSSHHIKIISYCNVSTKIWK